MSETERATSWQDALTLAVKALELARHAFEDGWAIDWGEVDRAIDAGQAVLLFDSPGSVPGQGRDMGGAEDPIGRATYEEWRVWIIESGYADHAIRIGHHTITPFGITICDCGRVDAQHHPDMVGYDNLTTEQRAKYQRMGGAGARVERGRWREAVTEFLAAARACDASAHSSINYTFVVHYHGTDSYRTGDFDAPEARLDAALAALEALMVDQ